MTSRDFGASLADWKDGKARRRELWRTFRALAIVLGMWLTLWYFIWKELLK